MENEKDIAISIKGLKKRYRLGVIGGGTLQGDIQSWWARVRGKDDPNLKIGKKVYGKNESFMALDGIDLTIYKGERVGIIGHNGAGKSTLLKLLSRVTAPTDGEICIDGRISSMLEVGTGFNGELTGRENIYLNGAILGMTTAEVDSKIEQIIEFSECRQFIDTPVKRYSSGMYVKLAFAVAAHLDSEILIMDEVLAVGDMTFQKKCLNKMSQVSKDEGRTILYVSHNMNTIRQLCDRCIVLDHGKIIFNGDVEEAITIYSGNTSSSSLTVYDFTKTPRPYDWQGVNLFITKFEFLEKTDAVFDKNDEMKFRIEFDAKKDISGLKLFLTVKSNNDNIGMAQTYKAFANVKANTHHSATFLLNISNLSPGDYYFTPDIFVDDGTGRHLTCDHPLCNVEFKIVDSKPTGLRWSAGLFGKVSLYPIINIKTD